MDKPSRTAISLAAAQPIMLRGPSDMRSELSTSEETFFLGTKPNTLTVAAGATSPVGTQGYMPTQTVDLGGAIQMRDTH